MTVSGDTFQPSATTQRTQSPTNNSGSSSSSLSCFKAKSKCQNLTTLKITTCPCLFLCFAILDTIKYVHSLNMSSTVSTTCQPLASLIEAGDPQQNAATKHRAKMAKQKHYAVKFSQQTGSMLYCQSLPLVSMHAQSFSGVMLRKGMT